MKLPPPHLDTPSWSKSFRSKPQMKHWFLRVFSCLDRSSRSDANWSMMMPKMMFSSRISTRMKNSRPYMKRIMYWSVDWPGVYMRLPSS